MIEIIIIMIKAIIFQIEIIILKRAKGGIIINRLIFLGILLLAIKVFKRNNQKINQKSIIIIKVTSNLHTTTAITLFPVQLFFQRNQTQIESNHQIKN